MPASRSVPLEARVRPAVLWRLTLKKKDYREIENGLYRVFWKKGGSSLAAVGTCIDGSRWLAPTNWVSATTVERHWRRISHVEQIVTPNGKSDRLAEDKQEG